MDGTRKKHMENIRTAEIFDENWCKNLLQVANISEDFVDIMETKASKLNTVK